MSSDQTIRVDDTIYMSAFSLSSQTSRSLFRPIIVYFHSLRFRTIKASTGIRYRKPVLYLEPELVRVFKDDAQPFPAEGGGGPVLGELAAGRHVAEPPQLLLEYVPARRHGFAPASLILPVNKWVYQYYSIIS